MSDKVALVEDRKVNLGGNKGLMSKKDIGDMLAGLDEGVPMTARYYEFGDGEVSRFVVVGTSEMPPLKGQEDKGNSLAIRMVDDKGDMVISAASVIASTLGPKALKIGEGEGEPFAVQISYLGKEKSNSGFKYDNFDICELH